MYSDNNGVGTLPCGTPHGIAFFVEDDELMLTTGLYTSMSNRPGTTLLKVDSVIPKLRFMRYRSSR